MKLFFFVTEVVCSVTGFSATPSGNPEDIQKSCAGIFSQLVKREVRKEYEGALEDALRETDIELQSGRAPNREAVDSDIVRRIEQLRSSPDHPELLRLPDYFSDGRVRSYSQVYWTQLSLRLIRILDRTLTTCLQSPHGQSVFLIMARRNIDDVVRDVQREGNANQVNAHLRGMDGIPFATLPSAEETAQRALELLADPMIPSTIRDDITFFQDTSRTLQLPEMVYGFQHFIEAISRTRD